MPPHAARSHSLPAAALHVRIPPYPTPRPALAQVATLCVSPCGTLLLAIDEDGRALLINRKRRALLHHFTFKARVAAAKFSPDGCFLAVAVGRLLQVRLACPPLAQGGVLRPLGRCRCPNPALLCAAADAAAAAAATTAAADNADAGAQAITAIFLASATRTRQMAATNAADAAACLP